MSNKTYKSIGEVARILNLVNKNNKKNITHTIRFWEKEFKQIKPKIFSGNRRYYDETSIDKLKQIKYLLKDKGMTIKGVKKFLNSEDSTIDETDKISIKHDDIKKKIYRISNLIKNLKK